MGEFDNFLESTGSMETYQDNKMAFCRKSLFWNFLIRGWEWKVASAESTFPSSIKNVTSKP